MKTLLMLFGVALLASSVSYASPCDDDVEKFCGDRQAGQGAIGSCIQDHKNEMSYSCRQWLDKMDHALRQLGPACGASAREYCRDVRPGYKRVYNCLKSNFDKLPTACQDALNAVGN